MLVLYKFNNLISSKRIMMKKIISILLLSLSFCIEDSTSQEFLLFPGPNLISFNVITNDLSIESYLESIEENITSIITQGEIGLFINDLSEEELDNAPSLKSFEYNPWDEPTREFVNSVIKMYLNPGDAIDKVTNSTFEAAPTDTNETIAAPAKTAAKKAAPAPAAESAAQSDDLESFLNDLEI